MAARKIERLLSCGARVCVVSPELVPELAALQKEGRLDYIADRYAGKYLDGATLVIGATDDEQTNAAISRDARAIGIPVNIVDDPQKCDLILSQLRMKMEKNQGLGRVWFDRLMAADLLGAIRDKDEARVKSIVLEITGSEVNLD